MTYRVGFFFYFVILFCCCFVDCCRHYTLGILRTRNNFTYEQRFCFFSFCFVIFIDILSSCGYFKMHFDVQKCSQRKKDNTKKPLMMLLPFAVAVIRIAFCALAMRSYMRTVKLLRCSIAGMVGIAFVILCCGYFFLFIFLSLTLLKSRYWCQRPTIIHKWLTLHAVNHIGEL